MTKLRNSFPYFLGPDEHCLKGFYNKVDRAGLVAMIGLFFANELFIRNGLITHRENSGQLWSKMALVLNGEIPKNDIFYIYQILVILFIFAGILLLFQPRWAYRPKLQELSRALPFARDVEKRYFYFENIFQKIAFKLWHFAQMPVFYIFVTLLPCMLFGSIRSLK